MFHINVEFDEHEASSSSEAFVKSGLGRAGSMGGSPSSVPSTLRDFGFDEAFLRDYLSAAAQGEVPARVIAVHRGRCLALIEGRDGQAMEAEVVVSGRLSHEAAAASSLPAVGDWIIARAGSAAPGSDLATPGGAEPGSDDPAQASSAAGQDASSAAPRNANLFLATAVLPRRSAFVRKAAGEGASTAQVLAANVDLALVVAAAGADFNPRRIERYVALSWEAGVEPLIVITKADLAEDLPALEEEAGRAAPGAGVISVSALEGRGLQGLSPWLKPGKTAVLLGSSGVGKSTLLNALAGRELAATGAVRISDERGRHTTTHRELHKLQSGALVIDGPGMREVQLWAGEEAVDAVFAEIEALAASCRFRDCRHEAEPGCAVRAALETGELEVDRYRSYLKLSREIAHLERREDPTLQREEADRWRAINKKMRGYSKERRAIQGRSF